MPLHFIEIHMMICFPLLLILFVVSFSPPQLFALQIAIEQIRYTMHTINNVKRLVIKNQTNFRI